MYGKIPNFGKPINAVFCGNLKTFAALINFRCEDLVEFQDATRCALTDSEHAFDCMLLNTVDSKILIDQGENCLII